MGNKRTDGRMQVAFTYNGKRYYCYGRTMKEARANELAKRKELEESIYKPGKELTLNEYHERWEAARPGTVKGSTICKQSFEYACAARTPIDAAGTKLGEMKLIDIERQNIKDAKAVLANQFSTTTVNGIIALLNHIFNDAMTERIIQWNPVRGVKPLQRTEPEARDTNHRALTEQETKAFFAAATDSWYLNLCRFLIASGCRCGEAGALRLFDIKADFLQIERTITKTENGTHVIGDSPKTKHGRRAIPYTDAIREAVEAQKKLNAAMFGGKVVDLNSCIFKTPDGKLLDASAVNWDIAKTCKAAGIERFTAHAFRDTFATRAVESGMNFKTLQEILGHANIGMTMNLYAHVMPETKQEEMRKIAIIF